MGGDPALRFKGQKEISIAAKGTLYGHKSLWLQSVKCVKDSANSCAADANCERHWNQNVHKACTFQPTCLQQPAKAQATGNKYPDQADGSHGRGQSPLPCPGEHRTIPNALSRVAQDRQAGSFRHCEWGEIFAQLYGMESRHRGSP